jgi:hypothetical protein
MDLSHWDMRQEFRLREAACLAAGVDPQLEVDAEVAAMSSDEQSARGLSDEQLARVNFIEEALGNAYERALVRLAYADLNCSVWPSDELPSVRLSEEPDAHAYHDTAFFGRETLARWFAQSGFKPKYDFAPRHGADDELGTKQRHSYTIILAALCSLCKIDPTKADKAARTIQAEAERLGFKIGETNIEEKLKLIEPVVQRARDNRVTYSVAR